ncbi:UDP-N-acetylenolpyruvoylglucosamine reductase [Coraliomargarita sinensis]|uniref:UDP-N-acetylenolpyruvoylglucosamine reductase n=1 Tax=Coraliomargarita sinensis TaxID=2174842 RepID=A0A317ZI31_9BACT|nr:UDP-N-acetylmuramate dehydrogenase [Coraliomargarita sinensis]PXA05255.1 UDP-N-acetylenolpyruvoylglucosamine reductase [Coraliomargarita sinensis]
MSAAGEPRYLFLGVGGMGMAPLACWMSSAGYSITGHDACLQEEVRQHLEASGVTLRDFVFPEQLGEFTTVVYSSAVRAGHPVLDAARSLGLDCLRRGEMLARMAEGLRLVAVIGSHGKTTTTGMIAYALQRQGIEANYILGGLFADTSLAPSRYSKSPWLVAEIDESDGTIENFSPEHTLVLNLDWDHADYYGKAAQLETAFTDLSLRTRQTVLLPDGMDLKGLDEAKVVRYASSPEQDFNTNNARAAFAALACVSNNLPEDVLEDFPGIARRQELLLDREGLTVIEDYAHHPTEIGALMQNLRERASSRQLLVVFQPHRFSRTRQFKEGFAATLSEADACYLLPVYAAHEPLVEGGELADMVDVFKDSEPVVLESGLAGLKQVNQAAMSRPALLAFIGAGDIEDFAAASVALLREPDSVDGACLGFLEERLSPEAKIKLNEPLANKTTMRIGGPARIYAEPASFADLQQLLKAAQLFALDYFCIGRGSNLLVADEGFDGLVIRFSAPAWRRVETLGAGRIWAAAGGRLKEICGFAAKAGLAGFEFLEGIPGAVGGALRMNAGAMGSWMFDVVERVQFIDANGHYQDWPREKFHFGYRRVEEISRGIALGAVLKSPESEEESSIRSRIDSYSTTRKESQPRGPSAGCIFKNPEGSYAGKLIDEHGLKGMRVGAAEVSAVHGNFIVNQGGATAGDVIELVRRIRAKVKAESGYDLEPEVLLVGRSWPEVLKEGADV